MNILFPTENFNFESLVFDDPEPFADAPVCVLELGGSICCLLNVSAFLHRCSRFNCTKPSMEDYDCCDIVYADFRHLGKFRNSRSILIRLVLFLCFRHALCKRCEFQHEVEGCMQKTNSSKLPSSASWADESVQRVRSKV